MKKHTFNTFSRTSDTLRKLLEITGKYLNTSYLQQFSPQQLPHYVPANHPQTPPQLSPNYPPTHPNPPRSLRVLRVSVVKGFLRDPSSPHRNPRRPQAEADSSILRDS